MDKERRFEPTMKRTLNAARTTTPESIPLMGRTHLRKRWLALILALALTAGLQAVSAEEDSAASLSPVMISLFNPVQLPPEDWDVTGFRLDPYMASPVMCMALTSGL